MYLLTLVSPMSIPSFSNSSWIFGAPHSEFSRLIVRISSRTSLGTVGRLVLPCRTFHVQAKAFPMQSHHARCGCRTASLATPNRATSRAGGPHWSALAVWAIAEGRRVDGEAQESPAWSVARLRKNPTEEAMSAANAGPNGNR